MSRLNLAPNETLLFETNEYYVNDKGVSNFYVTSKNIIIETSKGVFNTKYFYKTIPLSQLKKNNGGAAIIFKEEDDEYAIIIQTMNDNIKLSSDEGNRFSKSLYIKKLKEIGNIIAKAAGYGSVFNMQEKKGILASTFQKITSKVLPSNDPTNVTRKCVGCHAILSGLEGDVVVCEYCDTKQTL